jgi:hypothetical protein
VVLEEHNMGGLERGVGLGRSLGVMLMALMFWLVALALSAYFVGPAGIPLAIAAGAVFDRRRSPSTDGSTTKVKTVMSWLVIVACCSSIAWTLLINSEWFTEDLHELMLFWLVLPQLLWFGLRFFLDRSVPKDSQKNRLHTKQNKILLGACFVGALAIATDSPHRIRVAMESRFLNQAEQEIIRKCASDDAPTPRFESRNIYRWTCTTEGVSFEGGNWSKMFNRGGTWGFTKSQTKPTSTGQFGGYEELIPLGNDWWAWKQVTWDIGKTQR